MTRGPIPILIERTLLLNGDQPDPGVIEELVSFQRGGYRLLLIAPRPKRWRPTRKAVDRDLAVQQELHQWFSRAGAEIDGVYYLAAGLFARRSAMAKELDGIAQRYERNIGDITLIGTDSELLEAYREAGGPAISIGNGQADDGQRVAALAEALRRLNGRAG